MLFFFWRWVYNDMSSIIRFYKESRLLLMSFFSRLKKEKSQQQPPKNWVQALFRDFDIIYIFVAFMLVYVLFFRAVVVVGDSMYNTLASGDYLLVLNNLVYKDPKAGDIIVASKDSFRGGECIIKRVIATEGQEVDIDFSTGRVYVDGVLLDEPYLHSPTTRPEGVRFPLVVEEGCLFVMGDNRNRSTDSRTDEIGCVDTRYILGKAYFVMFPVKSFGGIQTEFEPPVEEVNDEVAQ
jgi:signal peptidase I